MSDYGVVCLTSLAEIQFDSRKTMKSYVLESTGTASSCSISTDSLVFVKGKAGIADLPVYGTASGGTYSFFTFDDSDNSSTAVSLDYMVCTPALAITPAAGDDYGLMVMNSDGTVQFDSRAIKEDEHFVITDYWLRQDLVGDPDAAGAQFITSDTAEYFEIRRNTGATIDPELQAVTGVQFNGTNGEFPKFVNFITSGSFEFGFTTDYYPNNSVLLIAELDV